MTTFGGEGDEQGDDELERRLDQIVQAKRAAFQAVRRQRKDLTLPEAIDLAKTIFNERGLAPSHNSDARALARRGLDPFWPWSHPITAYREGWFGFRSN